MSNGKASIKKSLKFYRSHRTEPNLTKYLDAKQKYKQLCKSKRAAADRNHLKHLDRCVNDAKLFWREVKNKTNKPKVHANISANEWFNHFANLFNQGCAANTKKMICV
ncbi:hypothetical protein ACF0H5_004527 [Mactra antiquata]